MILLVSELSYRYIEIPLKKFPYNETWGRIKQAFVSREFSRKKIPIYALTLLCVTTSIAFITAPSGTLTDEQQELQTKIEQNQQKAAQHEKEVLEKEKAKKEEAEISQNEKKTENSETKKETTSNSSSKKVDENIQKIAKAYNLTSEQVTRAKEMKITGFGDSVMLDAAPDLQALFPYLTVDAVVGRQLYASYEELNKLKFSGKLEDTLLVSLGTNGSWTDSQFSNFMKIIGEKREVYWLNVHVPTREWQNTVNQSLSKMEKKYKNLHVIDWYSYSKGKNSWFYDDDVHPNEVGLPDYTHLIGTSILGK
jgi:hypothetical protein